MRSVTTDYGGVAKLVFAASPFSNTLIGFHKKSPFHLVQCLVEGAFYVFVLMDYSIGLIVLEVLRARCSSLRGVP